MGAQIDDETDLWTIEEGAICIPFTQDQEEISEISTFPPTQKNETIVADHRDALYNLYLTAWSAFHSDTIAIIQRLYSSVLSELLTFIQNENEEDIHTLSTKMLLPSPEIPTIIVVGGDQSRLFADLTAEISANDSLKISQLGPSHFTSLQVALKTLIEGFIKTDETKKRKNTFSLSTYDLQLLCSWFNWASATRSCSKLLILISGVESCNPATLQDFLYICRNYLDRLPFTLIIGATSPEVSTSVFSLETRGYLSLQTIWVPEGQRMFDTIIKELFFELNAPTRLVPSGVALRWLSHSWNTYNTSLDSFLSYSQLLHLFHFQDPSALFWGAPTGDVSGMVEIIQNLQSEGLRQSLAECLGSDIEEEEVETISYSINSTAQQFHQINEESKYAFLILVEVQSCLRLLLAGVSNAKELSISFIELAILYGDGKLAEVAAKLGSHVRLLTGAQLVSLVETLRAFSNTNGVPDDAFDTRLGDLCAIFPTIVQSGQQQLDQHPLSGEFSQNLLDLWSNCPRWTDIPLHQTWYSGSSVPPIDILNPSLRSSLLSAMLRPVEYLFHDIPLSGPHQENSTPSPSKLSRSPSKKKKRGKDKVESGVEASTSYAPHSFSHMDPDTCILFRRYTEAGKVINLYDWFESFVVSVEGERGEMAEEEWRKTVHARFMWSLHELDLLGVLRWTGRGAGKKGEESVGKAVWVAPED